MPAHRKVVPPVTPRIIQPNPRRRLFQLALVLGVFLLTAWFSYDYGRSQLEPASLEAKVQPDQALQQANTALEQERNTLRQQIAKLEQDLTQTQQDLRGAQARIQTLRDAASAQRETAPEASPQTLVSAPQAVSAPAPAAASTPATEIADAISGDNSLRLENVRIVTTGSEGVFRISFSVARHGDKSDRVTGTIWIAVNGVSGGQPKRLSFKKLSSDRRSYVKMGFEQRQDVAEDLVLPDNFQPRNVLIEAKPYGDTYTGASGKFSWSTTG